MAALALKEGSLYFLRDKDFLTGEVGRYVKIGIVRDDRSAEKRMLEHQTGNPRGMLNAATLKEVPFVEKLETLLHYRFNEKWVTGEWFELSDKELEVVLKEAERMRKEQRKYKEAVHNGAALASECSNGRTRKAEKKELKLRDAHNAVLKLLNETKAKLKLTRAALYAALGKNGYIEGVMKVIQTVESSGLNKSALKKHDAALYESYCTVGDTKISGSLSVDGKNDSSLAKCNEALSKKIKELPKESFTKSQLEKKRKRSKAIEKLHAEHLALKQDEYAQEWELDLIKYRLMDAVGKYDTIEGVCTWKREEKAGTPKFDEQKFKTEHPRLYKRFHTTKAGAFKVDISKYREYRPK